MFTAGGWEVALQVCGMSGANFDRSGDACSTLSSAPGFFILSQVDHFILPQCLFEEKGQGQSPRLKAGHFLLYQGMHYDQKDQPTACHIQTGDTTPALLNHPLLGWL